MLTWIDRKYPAIFLTVCVLVLCGAYAIYGAGARQIHDVHTVVTSVSNTNDTAQSMDIVPLFAVDSYTYICSVLTTTSPVDSQAISYTTPAQRVKLEIKYQSAVQRVDTSRVFVCTLAFATDSVKIDFDPADVSMTLAKWCDTVVYLINNTAVVKDSVKAEDSTTYVLVRGKFPQTTTYGGHQFHFLFDADTARFDTTTRANTVATICSGLKTAAEAVTDLNTQYTFSNQDTLLRMTAKKKGLPFVYKVPASCPVDTLDSTTFQANVAGRSRNCDTFDLVQLVGEDRRAGGIYGNIILKPSATTYRGLGLSDSGLLWFQTRMNIDTGTTYYVLDSTKKAALPCTLHIARSYAATNDTLFKPIGSIIWVVSDTTSDSTTPFEADYDIAIDLMLLDQ
jgi:hypothetical protein